MRKRRCDYFLFFEKINSVYLRKEICKIKICCREDLEEKASGLNSSLQIM